MLNKKSVRTQNFAFPLKKAFTLIELLVVIAIIGILATLAVVALQQARSNARDAKRISDVRQMQMALELYYYENGGYPTELEFQTGNSLVSSSTGEVFMQIIPSAPSVADGDCQSASNTYSYVPSGDNSSYILSFCTGKQVSDLPAGQLCATPGGIIPCDGGVDGGEQSTVCSPACEFPGQYCDNGSCLALSGSWLKTVDETVLTYSNQGSSIISTASGDKIIASNNDAQIAFSTDYGNSWVYKNLPDTGWGPDRVFSMTSSSDLSTLIFSSQDRGDIVYTSNDFGDTWNEYTVGVWASAPLNIIKSCSQGKYILTGRGVDSNGKLAVSSDFGQNWNVISVSQAILSINVSDDGRYMSFINYLGEVSVSSDFGQTWTVNDLNDSSNSWEFYLTASANGKNLTAVLRNDIFSSSDYGNSWEKISSGPFFGGNVANYIKSSRDGSRLILMRIGYEDYIYTSYDYGYTWEQQSNYGCFGGAVFFDDDNRINLVLSNCSGI